jgi:hypothetical protein
MGCHLLSLHTINPRIRFYHLHKEYNCLLQMGGSDQWGILLGT